MAQVKDPVCGMQIEQDDAFGPVDHEGRAYYFCSDDCKETFEEDPDDYTGD